MVGSEGQISGDEPSLHVFVIPTDEELILPMISEGLILREVLGCFGKLLNDINRSV
jgi:hypothetical protein